MPVPAADLQGSMLFASCEHMCCSRVHHRLALVRWQTAKLCAAAHAGICGYPLQAWCSTARTCERTCLHVSWLQALLGVIRSMPSEATRWLSRGAAEPPHGFATEPDAVPAHPSQAWLDTAALV